jgi:hypothetical protein
MDHRIVGEAFERTARILADHPPVERIMQEPSSPRRATPQFPYEQRWVMRSAALLPLVAAVPVTGRCA